MEQLLAALDAPHASILAFVVVATWQTAAIFFGVKNIRKNFDEHEKEDQRRHEENLQRFETIEKDIKKLFWGKLSP